MYRWCASSYQMSPHDCTIMRTLFSKSIKTNSTTANLTTYYALYHIFQGIFKTLLH